MRRGTGRAGLLRLSEEGPTGCKQTPVMFLGNTVQSVHTFIQTRTCTRVSYTQAPRKDLHALIQIDPTAAVPSSSPRPNPQARSSPRPEAGPALPQLLHAGPGVPAARPHFFCPFLGSGQEAGLTFSGPETSHLLFTLAVPAFSLCHCPLATAGEDTEARRGSDLPEATQWGRPSQNSKLD